MALINECINSGIDFDRVFFLSGLDYPIWSNQQIIAKLESTPTREYIAGYNLSRCNNPEMKIKFSITHRFRDMTCPEVVRKGFCKIWRMLMLALPIRRNVIEIGDTYLEIYYGSSWWCLTMDCLRYVANKMADVKLQKFFRTTFTPDEMFVQTIVFNSSFAENAMRFNTVEQGLAGLTPLHYIEYCGAIKVFSSGDYDKLVSSGKMFLRKAMTDISDSLLNRIDRIR